MSTEWESGARPTLDLAGPVFECPVSHEKEHGFYAKGHWESVYVC